MPLARLALLVVFATVAPALARAGCKEPELARLDRSLAERHEDHWILAAAGLDDACELPSTLKKAISTLRQLGDEWAPHAALDVIQADPALWTRACPGGLRFFSEMLHSMDEPQFGPRERARLIWDRCRVEQLGVATADDWARAGRTAELALLLAAWMRETKQAPARVRAYTRALAGLDEPRPKTLAELYPDDGLAPNRSPRPAGAATMESKLSHYLGRKDLAEALAETVSRDRADLARCFNLPAAPPDLTLKLVIADGVAQQGMLLSVREVGYVIHEDPLRAEPAFVRCMLARAARLRFQVFANPTTIEVHLSPLRERPLATIVGGSIGGVEGGIGDPSVLQARAKTVASSKLTRRTGAEIPPPSPQMRALLAAKGRGRSALLVRLCLSEEGSPSEVKLLLGSGVADYDEEVLRVVRSWRYEPYVEGGAPRPVCTSLMLRVALQP